MRCFTKVFYGLYSRSYKYFQNKNSNFQIYIFPAFFNKEYLFCKDIL